MKVPDGESGEGQYQGSKVDDVQDRLVAVRICDPVDAWSGSHDPSNDGK